MTKSKSKSAEARFLNRELSWLEFNQRVLDEAKDDSIPLLERLKFLAITDSNLDEFFMVRVGGLKMMVERGENRRDPSGQTADEQLQAIRRRARTMQQDQYACYMNEIEPELARSGIRRALASELNETQLNSIRDVFESEAAAVMTPMAVDVENFPLLVNHTLNVLVRLDPEEPGGESRFAVIPLFRTSRFQALEGGGGYNYVLAEDVVCLFVEMFFPGEIVQEATPFRITRNADIAVQEELAPDLMTGMQEVLDARKVGGCVRLQIGNQVSEESLEFLCRSLEIARDDVFLVPGPLGLSAFMQFSDIRGFDSLKYRTWAPQHSANVDPSVSVFETLAKQDLVLYHPYESFDFVVRMLEEAADDPDVLAIKQTLYRTSRDSPIVAALERAAQNGKNVSVVVELKARFDEARNIHRARMLEQAGVQVIYGVKSLKTHAKICIIVRREAHGVQRYVHVGTGNYNESTARLYSDVSYMTQDPDIGADATVFFNAITGFSQPQQFRKFEMAPLGLRQRVLELIETEIKRKRAGQTAGISAKLNSLVDPDIINALYEASSAGVSVRLNIRGICCLRPGVPGLSDKIRVVSIIDRFLEHARIFHFKRGGDDLVFLSSADWMPRNLDRRVELLTPVDDRRCKQRLMQILDMHFKDNVKGRRLRGDGGYDRPAPGKKPFRSQEALYEQAVQALEDARRSRQLVFEPHQSPLGED